MEDAAVHGGGGPLRAASLSSRRPPEARPCMLGPTAAPSPALPQPSFRPLHVVLAGAAAA